MASGSQISAEAQQPLPPTSVTEPPHHLQTGTVAHFKTLNCWCIALKPRSE